MTNIKNLLNYVKTMDPNKEKINREAYTMYQKVGRDSADLIGAISTTGTAGARERILNIMKLVEENIIGKKTKTIPESKKLDIAQGGKSESEDEQGGIDTKDIPPLEDKKEAARRQQKGQGLKIMTPSQLITGLPLLLAQLKAGNNSQKLKNETKQIAYSLYRSKNLSKLIHNLINTI